MATCLHCDADNTRDYPVCSNCETHCHFSNRADCRCEPCKWIDYRDAAKLMARPQDYFRIKNADGSYKFFPQVERWQPGGRRTRLLVRREHVLRWIEASRTPAPVKQEFSGIGYESALPTMRRLGAYGTMKSFGLK